MDAVDLAKQAAAASKIGAYSTSAAAVPPPPPASPPLTPLRTGKIEIADVAEIFSNEANRILFIRECERYRVNDLPKITSIARKQIITTEMRQIASKLFAIPKEIDARKLGVRLMIAMKSGGWGKTTGRARETFVIWSEKALTEIQAHPSPTDEEVHDAKPEASPESDQPVQPEAPDHADDDIKERLTRLELTVHEQETKIARLEKLEEIYRTTMKLFQLIRDLGTIAQ